MIGPRVCGDWLLGSQQWLFYSDGLCCRYSNRSRCRQYVPFEARGGTILLFTLFRDLFRFFGSDVNLFLILGCLFKIPDSLSNSFADLGELPGTKNDEYDD